MTLDQLQIFIVVAGREHLTRYAVKAGTLTPLPVRWTRRRSAVWCRSVATPYGASPSRKNSSSPNPVSARRNSILGLPGIAR